MNHTYRLIWSHRSHCFVAVGEHARRCGKSVRGAALVIAGALAAAMSPTAPASAAPTGGEVKNGTGTITRFSSGNPALTNTAITQTSPRLVIDWTSFSSAPGESIAFIQKDSSAIALNRVTGRTPSELLGNLTAPGQVFVVNPNGVLFGEKASVNVGGLLASTLDMKGDSFFSGNYVLEGGGMGAVVNKGALTARTGGYIVLAGPRVINESGVTHEGTTYEGTINAVQGKVLMAAGDKVTLSLNGSSLASYTIDRGSLDALVQNSGRISASEGDVTLTANAANDIGRAVINHTGIIEANSLQGTPGKIRLLGTGEADMLVNGKLNASGAGGNGGLVETNAARVNIGEKAEINGKTPDKVTAGTWTNTSTDFVIAEGNGPQTTSSIGADKLSSLLGGKDPVELFTQNLATGAGNLYVNAKVEWPKTSESKLTLSASRNIYINKNISGSMLTLRYGQAIPDSQYGYFLDNGVKIDLPQGYNFFASANKAFENIPYYVITKLGDPKSATGKDLQGLSNAVTYYVLGDDIEASATKNWGSAGFVPISQFYGKLDGLGHAIKNLYINNAGADSVGLFDILAVTTQGNSVFTGRVQNLTLENASVTKTGVSSGTGIGALAGTNNGEIFNVHATMSVTSFSNNTGGLVGINNGKIKSSSAVGVVTLQGNNDAEATGGLVGRQVGKETSDKTKKLGGTIIDSYAAVDVTGNRSVGGLVGLMEKSSTGIENPTVTGSYAGVSVDTDKGSVWGKENVGGLVGYLQLGRISDSYAAVPVTGTNASSAAIGGLVGLLGGAVERAYASGPVRSGNADKTTVGGLIGNGAGLALNSFWNINTTGQPTSRGGTSARGITIDQMRSLSTFNGWTIDAEGGTGKTWRIYDGQTAPLLRSFLVTKDVEAKSVTYDQKTQSGCTGTPCDSDARNPLFTAASGDKAGTYAPYSTQQGYDIRGGKLTIAPLLLMPTATPTAAAVKTYNGDATVSQANLLSVTALGADAFSVSYTARYDNENAGSSKTVNFSDVKLVPANTDMIPGNYEMADTFSINTGKITPRPVSLSGTKVDDKEYDGTKVATVNSIGTLNGILDKDKTKVTVSASKAEFVDENAATNKKVTVSVALGSATGSEAAANYTIADTPEATATISKRLLKLSDTKVDDKEYDGTTAATVSSIGTLGRVLDTDKNKVTVSASKAEFVDENAATNKKVTVSVALNSEAAANYTIADTAEATATISKRLLKLSDTKVDDKTYDGTTAATVSSIGTLGRVLDNDKNEVRISASGAAFVDENAGTNKTVSLSGVVLAGERATNYMFADTTVSTNATIMKRVLTLSDTKINDRDYDGTTAATLSSIGTLGNVVAKDKGKVTVSASGAAFADKNASTNKVVTVSGVALADTDTANYAIADTVKATATIRPRPLAVRAQAVDKVYDGNTNATATLGDDRIQGDKLDLRYAKASFADSNAGSGKTVTVAGIAASGADAGNYLADTNAVTTASVSKAPLTITANPDSKAFDGKAYRGGNGVTYAGFATGENATVLSGQPSYGGDAQGAVNIGTYHIAPGGYASQNYAIVYVDGKLTIQQPPLEPVYQAAGTEVAATAAAVSGAASNLDSMRLLSQQATLQVAGCGTRLPERPLAVAVDCSEGRTSGSARSMPGF